MRRIVAAIIATVLLAGGLAAYVERDVPLARLPLPPRGEVRPDWLDDGLPVFVVHRSDGEVRVLDARSPHRPQAWSHLVGWCPSSGVFEDPWHGSRFAWTGHWMGGPAPVGLAPLAATVSGGHVRVGPPGEPPSRDDPAHPADGAPSGPSCLTAPSPYPASDAGMLLHDALVPDSVAWLDEAVAQGDGRWTPAAGAVLHMAGEPVRLCRNATGEPPRCPDAVTWVRQSLHEGRAWSVATGRFLVRARQGDVRDVIALAETDHDVRLVGVERHFALATRITEGPEPSLVYVPAAWLGGEQANEAARRDGVIGPDETVPNDYYIDVPDADARAMVPLAPNVVVWGSISLTGTVEPWISSVTAMRELLERSRSPLPVWVEIERASGLAVVVEEQYRP